MFLKNVKEGKVNSENLDEKLANFRLTRGQIPKPLLKEITGKRPDTRKKQKKWLERMIEETKELIAEKKPNETGLRKVGEWKPKTDESTGKAIKNLKSGDMANFLAHDIIALQPPLEGEKRNGKPNEKQFQVLQAKLAYFGREKEDLYSFYKSLRLVNSKNRHPFLHKKSLHTKNQPGIGKYYSTYLKERKQYLKDCLKKCKKEPSEYDKLHFIKVKPSRDTNSLIEGYEKKEDPKTVINFPRGYIYKELLKQLKSNQQEKELALLEGTDRSNTSFFLKKYLTELLKDDFQPFYKYKRAYPLLNELFGEKYYDEAELSQMMKLGREESKVQNEGKTNDIRNKAEAKMPAKKKEDYLDKFKVAYRDFTEHEKKIRHYRTTDILLFLMAKEQISKEFTNMGASNQADIESYKLQEVYPKSESGLLGRISDIELNVYFGKKDEVESKTILARDVKVKNYGYVRRFLKDKRLEGLLPYLPDETIELKALENELDWYNSGRLEVIEKILQFEAVAVERLNLKLENKAFMSHKEILKHDEVIPGDTEKIDRIGALRNAFCHNRYPKFDKFKEVVNGSGFNSLKDYTTSDEATKKLSISHQLKELTIKAYQELIDKLKGKVE